MLELLKDVKVLECAVLMTGDFTGRLLADMGADVLKVESPGQGDYLRDIGGTITPHNSLYHLMGNRNKRSMTLDLRSNAGREIFFEMLAGTDIFVDGFAGDACARLGIGYEDQVKKKPDIIYVQTSGFGTHGPYASIPTHGMMMNAVAGGAALRMGEDGLVHPDPEKKIIGPATSVQDVAVYAAMSAAAAMVRRGKTGKGCYIDTAACDAVIANCVMTTNSALNDHRVTDRDGVPRTGDSGQGAKYQYYETKDRRFILFCGMEHKFWRNFCRAVGREDLLDHTIDKYDFDWGLETDLRHEVQAIFHTRTQAEWVEVAKEHDIAMGPAYDATEFRDDPHIRERGIVFDAEHPQVGPYTYFGWPARITDMTFDVYQPAPTLGEHTDEVLRELGRDTDEITNLRADGVI